MPELAHVSPEVQPTWEEASAALANPKARIEDRYRAVFFARTFGGPKAVEALQNLLRQEETKSVLLRHEACYVLGQMQATQASPLLRDLLESPLEHEMVRHEAAEALGAIEDVLAAPLIDKHAVGPAGPLQETCLLASHRLEAPPTESESSEIDKVAGINFNTVDPIKLSEDEKPTEADVDRLASVLGDSAVPLPDRYQALFQLRSVSVLSEWGIEKPSLKALQALTKILETDESSALLRHELCFVIAQMAFGYSEEEREAAGCVKSLVRSTFDSSENCMVRHEAAVALGTLGGREAEACLRKIAGVEGYSAEDQETAVVVESAKVALDAAKYWGESREECMC